MTDQQQQEEDGEPEFKPGDKVKNLDNNNWEQPYARAVVTDTLDDQEGKIEIMPLEEKVKGEKQVKDTDDIGQLKQKTWLCMIGHSYGVSQEKELALRNALQNYDVDPDNRSEPVQVWMAQVDRTNWEIYGMGSVRSSFIDNEEDIEIEPELAKEIGDRAEDTVSLVYSALDGAEPYREGLNYEAVTNTQGY